MATARRPKDDDRRARHPGAHPELSEQAALARLLIPAETGAVASAPDTSAPLILFVGVPRSGATLLLQWLGSTGSFAYPSNLVARFSAAPVIGARVQRLLFDAEAQKAADLSDLRPAPPGFESDYGRTTGTLGVNHFTEFWQRHIGSRELEPLGARTRDVDVRALRSTLAALTQVEGKPFAALALPLIYDLEFFAAALPEALFVHVVRDGVQHARSLLTARKKLLGSVERWFSVKPPEYRDLVALPPAEQVVGQVRSTNQHIGAALATLPAERRMTIEYEHFCQDPRGFGSALAALVEARSKAAGDVFRRWTYQPSEGAPTNFEPRTGARAKGAELDAVATAWQQVERSAPRI